MAILPSTHGEKYANDQAAALKAYNQEQREKRQKLLEQQAEERRELAKREIDDVYNKAAELAAENAKAQPQLEDLAKIRDQVKAEIDDQSIQARVKATNENHGFGMITGHDPYQSPASAMMHIREREKAHQERQNELAKQSNKAPTPEAAQRIELQRAREHHEYEFDRYTRLQTMNQLGTGRLSEQFQQKIDEHAAQLEALEEASKELEKKAGLEQKPEQGAERSPRDKSIEAGATDHKGAVEVLQERAAQEKQPGQEENDLAARQQSAKESVERLREKMEMMRLREETRKTQDQGQEQGKTKGRGI